MRPLHYDNYTTSALITRVKCTTSTFVLRADLESRYTSRGDVVATCAPAHGHVNPMTWEEWQQIEGSSLKMG